MLEGFILQNTLLLKDISAASRQFKNLHVLFDSILLFGALGLRGAATETATRELLSLLKDTGALLDVFEPTIREMRRILAVYENRLGTYEGRMSLYPTDLTRYFLTNKCTPSDVRTQGVLIESNLRALGFNVREIPARQAHLTLDEADLGTRMAERPGAENVPRVVHDINCVAGVLTLRGGRVSAGLDEAQAVFVTTSGSIVRETSEWYEAQGGRGFPPIIHQLMLSNLAWLKRPASASKLKLHELVALCAAALRPTRKAWQTFLNYLRKLEETGELSSDEVTAIVASGLTDDIMAEEGVEEDSDADTLSEVVDRVKASYIAETNAEIGAARQLRMRIERRARSIGRAVSWALAALLAASLVAGTAVSISDAVRSERPSVVALALAIVPLAVVCLFGALVGFHVKAWRHSLEERLTKWLIRWIAGVS